MSTWEIFLESFLQALAAGLLIGGIYGLMCLGLAVIFSIMRIINFAQGDLMMLGMYCAYAIFLLLGVSSIVPTYLSILACIPIMFAVGYVIHWLLISKVSGSRSVGLAGEGNNSQLILTLGLSLILENGVMMLIGSQVMTIQMPLTGASFEIGPLLDGTVDVFVNKGRLVAALISVVVFVLFVLLINRSRLGRALRASADNPVAAQYMGIDVDRAYRFAFGLGTCVTALAGGLLATNYPFHPFVGLEFVIVMFAGVVLGGMGSIFGAFWGGMLIGLVQQFSSLVLPTQLQNATIFVFFLLIMFVRPQGLFGRVSERT